MYRGKINRIEVPIDDNTTKEASQWLEERLGPSTMMAHKTRELMESTPPYDPTYLFTTDYLWDAYIDPNSFKAFFQIKGNDETAMLFKLTFGGRSI